MSKRAFEQLPKESEKAYGAFSLYLSMGPERSLAAVGQKLGKSVGLLERWSRKYDWAARVQAYAAHMAVVEREATEALARSKAAEWLKRTEEVREREWEMHEKCIEAARRGLKAFMEREKVYANLSDISRILEVASKLGRLASGMATDKTEVTGEDGGPLRVELSAALERVYGQAQPAPTLPPPTMEPVPIDVEAKVLAHGHDTAELPSQKETKVTKGGAAAMTNDQVED
jgi:hypothetical protein